MLEGIGHTSATCAPMGTHSGTKHNPQARVVGVIWTGCPHSIFHRHIARHTYLQLSRRHRKAPAVHLIVHLPVGIIIAMQCDGNVRGGHVHLLP
jgi:hypothetical protein